MRKSALLLASSFRSKIGAHPNMTVLAVDSSLTPAFGRERPTDRSLRVGPDMRIHTIVFVACCTLKVNTSRYSVRGRGMGQLASDLSVRTDTTKELFADSEMRS